MTLVLSELEAVCEAYPFLPGLLDPKKPGTSVSLRAANAALLEHAVVVKNVRDGSMESMLPNSRTLFLDEHSTVLLGVGTWTADTPSCRLTDMVGHLPPGRPLPQQFVRHGTESVATGCKRLGDTIEHAAFILVQETELGQVWGGVRWTLYHAPQNFVSIGAWLTALSADLKDQVRDKKSALSNSPVQA